MKEFYVYPDEAKAKEALDYINNSGWFPIIGLKFGVPNPTKGQTTSWRKTPKEMFSGEFAIDRIPEKSLDSVGELSQIDVDDGEGGTYKKWVYPGVPQEDRESFISAFGQDIRELSAGDFVPPPEEVT